MVSFRVGGNFLRESSPFEELVAVMARLRGPEGCPWDREQTLQTLRTYLVEETYELIEAIEAKDPLMLREELGDLLLEVVFLAQVCSEQGLFGIDEVVGGIRDKLVRRHPHVFGDRKAENAHEAIRRWEDIKNEERASSGDAGHSLLSGVPAHMPALLRAHRLSTKAALAGFDWKQLADLYEKLFEELAEFRQAADEGDRPAMEEELGDLLFITANLGRFSGIDPELALQAANRKFIARFHHVESGLKAKGIEPGKSAFDQMELLWEEAKSLEKREPPDQSTSSR
ncbi:MAG TPA: nucleoside triphosphate pyrophosphohydrolase [Patescibacteria group bacterium]|nr:nucleoside triphosphate pyrophosphohydrolase [Patescibacteria group bacterium]